MKATGADRRAMVLIHGAGGDHTVWGEIHIRLRKMGIPVLALDLPGHGRNPSPAPSTVAARADAVHELIAANGATEYVLAGHSMGGAISLTLAARGTPSIRGLAVVSSGARLPVDPRVLKGTLTAFSCTVEHLARFLFARGAPPERIRLAAEMLSASSPETLHADLVACANFSITAAALRSIRIPTEVVCGDADVLTPLPLAQEVTDLIPRSRLTVLPGVGHMPLLEDPAGLAAVLERTWQRAFDEGPLDSHGNGG